MFIIYSIARYLFFVLINKTSIIVIMNCLLCLLTLEQELPNSEARLWSEHNSLLVFLVGQNPTCSGYNQRLFISKISDIIKEKTKETS